MQHLAALPAPLLRKLLADYLLAHAVLALARSCKQLREFAGNDDVLWRSLYRRDYPARYIFVHDQQVSLLRWPLARAGR